MKLRLPVGEESVALRAQHAMENAFDAMDEFPNDVLSQEAFSVEEHRPYFIVARAGLISLETLWSLDQTSGSLRKSFI